MTYKRVIPRDLFNEANLLKCYGRLAILLEQTAGHVARLVDHLEVGDQFEIIQDPSDGSISISNVQLFVATRLILLWRPLNSREPWPLIAQRKDDPDFEEIEVFDQHGFFSPKMLRLIGVYADAS